MARIIFSKYDPQNGHLIDKLARAKALRERSGSKDTEVIEVLTNLIKEL